MLKKQEEAKELLVRALVTNNNLLMLNHPIYEEQICFWLSMISQDVLRVVHDIYIYIFYPWHFFAIPSPDKTSVGYINLHHSSCPRRFTLEVASNEISLPLS
ncbi:hypothetical protein EUGRSUZ_D00548 [Eucalyptus grandis]|uniref:Uncharacterized protein n=2 Tax=Eucalyptus grandis TaxID=71139 RepID=A0ACC3L2U4_EUCGR|nr:hypothetical protein EUGRSUZ_D00548 [Eucalyptus grandis]